MEQEGNQGLLPRVMHPPNFPPDVPANVTLVLLCRCRQFRRSSAGTRIIY
jgi:hypothetical protein